MTNIILCGCGGRMGAAVYELVKSRGDSRIVAGVDVNTSTVTRKKKHTDGHKDNG